jgi:hypothetical protein
MQAHLGRIANPCEDEVCSFARCMDIREKIFELQQKQQTMKD